MVLLAPSCNGLQFFINIALEEANKLNLTFNEDKTKCMIFGNKVRKVEELKSFTLNSKTLEFVSTFKYLGYFVQSDLKNSVDIDNNLHRFYKEFIMILRKFNFADSQVKLYLFKQCCLQIYGSDLWFCNKGSVSNLKQFGIAYHKAIKKIFSLSTHESNHFVCELAKMLTFEHYLNKNIISFAYRMLEKSCNFISKIKRCFKSSFFLLEVYGILKNKYDIESLLDNDREALWSRISYVQNHETQMREGWI